MPHTLPENLTPGAIGLVVIGRNEGERLVRCLASVRAIPKRVYVDSGSSDDSVARARAEGATVVELAVPPQPGDSPIGAFHSSSHKAL